VDGELETILLKALEKEQARRYASAREVGEDIRRYLTGEPILAKRASTLYLLRKRIRRNRSTIAVAVSALALGLAGVWGGFWWSQRTLDRQLAETLARERREVLLMQRGLEIGDERLAKDADFAFAQYRHLEEAPLVTARARWEADNVEEAIALLKGQLSKQPRKWPCRELLADLYRHLDEEGAPEAAARHQRAVERQDVPDNAETWYLRSFTTLDPELALDRAYEAVDLDPEHALAWERILYLCLDLEDYQGALAAAGRLMGLADDPVKWIRERTRIEALLASAPSEERARDGASPAGRSTQPTSAPALLGPGPPIR
jgi:tetratricopeptide (TPR) repeat protein